MKRQYLLISLLLLTQVFTFNYGMQAQNSGPIAPEAVSFEPVDATDMVNLATGDLSYVLPLIEIPGPEGGYPVALSYHGGITMDQEASWIGLGWNMNPGAINRTINGFPDDWKNKTFSNIIYDDGGSDEYYHAELSIEYKKISVGLNYSWGSYKAFGGHIGLGFKKTPFNISLSANTKGDVSLGVGASFGLSGGPASIGGGLSIGTNGVSGKLSFGVGRTIGNTKGFHTSAGASVGIGFSSHGSSSSIGILGATIPIDGMSRISSGDYAIEYDERGILFIIGSYTYKKITWWLFQVKEKSASGTLYLENERNDEGGTDSWGLQSQYHKMDISEVRDHPNANLSTHYYERNNTLMFPAYDNYQVIAQGLGGSITPRVLEDGFLVGDSRELVKNVAGDARLLYYYSLSDEDEKYNTSPSELYFAFNYSNNSYLRVEPSDWSRLRANDDVLGDWGADAGAIDVTNDLGKTNYNISKKRRITGKHVEWITNIDIVNNVRLEERGFLRPDGILNSDRSNTDLFDPDGIGSLLITTEDGKTYHYSLPVYQFEEIYRDESDKDESTGEYSDFYEKKKLDKYAYTWLLTAVTGPDYIDRGGANGSANGVVDETDFGYWVKFEYGKWTDGYIWQSPYRKEDSEYERYDGTHVAYSWGRKQIYYLNSIQTRTHTAYFIKNLREDGLGKDIGSFTTQEYYSGVGIDQTNACGMEKSGTIKNVQRREKKWYTMEVNLTEKHKVLKLEKIILVKNEDAILNYTNTSHQLINKSNIESQYLKYFLKSERWVEYRKYTHIPNPDCRLSSTCSDCPNTTGYVYCGSCIPCDQLQWSWVDKEEDCGYFEENVSIDFDIYFQNSILDVFDLPSGFESKALRIIEFDQDYDLCHNTPNSNGGQGQKLTLNSVKILGLNGTKVMPDYNFEYYQGADVAGTSGNYNKQTMDTWGFTKTFNGSEYANKPSHIWSLKEIETPLGAKIHIEYESDSYIREAALGDGNNKYKVNLTESSTNYYSAQLNETLIPDLIFIDEKDYNLNIQYRLKVDEPDDGIHFNEVDKNVTVKVKDIYNSSNRVRLYINGGLTQDDINYGNYTLTGEKSVFYGGGVRTTKVELNDEMGNTYQTFYSYNDPVTNKTSGVTSYTPFGIAEKYIPYMSELPIPNVMYEFVTVEEQGINGKSNGKTQYHFEVLQGSLNPDSKDFSMGDLFVVDNNQNTTENTYIDSDEHRHSVKLRSSVIKDNKSAIGRLLSVKQINNLGEEIKKTEYQYYKPDYVAGVNPNIHSGILQETFKHRKRYYAKADDYSYWSFNTSSRCMYPSIPWSTKVTENGLTTVTEFTKYDFNTGQLLEQQNYLPGTRKTIKTVKTPAYTVYNGDVADNPNDIGMGSKVDNIYNKNMLVQLAGEKVYDVGTGKIEHLLGASVQTWNNDWNYREYDSGYQDRQETAEKKKVWRKEKSFVWKGDITEDGYYKDFDASKDYDFGVTDADNKLNGWQKTTQITRYNHYSSALEAKGINDKYAASRMDLKDEKVMATVANADYLSFTYTGFEEEKMRGSLKDWGGEIIGSGSRVSSEVSSHTGSYYLQLPASGLTISLSEFEKNRMYRASVWVRGTSPASTQLSSTSSACGTTGDETCRSIRRDGENAIKMGNWYLLNITFKAVNGSSVVIRNNGGGGNIYIDDLRIHPLDAPMQSYVYDQKTGLVTAILNADNYATKFEYDDAGRLIETYKETPTGFKKISEHSYNYAARDVVITKHPYSDSPIPWNGVCQGTLVTLYAEGLNAENYQWQRRNGSSGYTNYGGNSNKLTLSNSSAGTFSYRCILSNSDPSSAVTSYSIGVRVNSSALSFTQQPTDQVYCGGATFEIEASGASSYEWWRNTVTNAPAEWRIIPGADFRIYDVNNLTNDPIGSQYYCVINGGDCGNGTVTSNIVTLHDSSTPTAPYRIYDGTDYRDAIEINDPIYVTSGSAIYFRVDEKEGCTYDWNVSMPNVTTTIVRGNTNEMIIGVSFAFQTGPGPGPGSGPPGSNATRIGEIKVRYRDACGNYSPFHIVDLYGYY